MVTIQRDVGTFVLAKGRISLLGPANGRAYGAVFIGEGRFTMTPPLRSEREHLLRLTKSPQVDASFRAAVFFFTDATVQELDSQLTWSAGAVLRGAEYEVQDAMKYLSDDDGWVARDIMTPLLNGGSGFFYAHLDTEHDGPLMFSVSPYQQEEVSLYTKARRGDDRTLLTRFHKRSDLETGMSLPPEALDLIRVLDYDVNTEIAGNLDVTGTTTERFVAMQANHPWVPFSLHNELEVDSVKWADGSAPQWVRPKDSGSLWVDISSASTDTSTLTFYYHGDLLDKPSRSWVRSKTFSGWYPVHAFDRPATYRLTFTTPEKYTVGTVGTPISETTEDKFVTRVWQTGPVRNVAFTIGEFDTETVGMLTGPPLTVQVNEDAHKRLTGRAIQVGIAVRTQDDMGLVVGQDLSRAASFFYQVLGPPPVPEMVASEIPYDVGLAYPGLVLLSWSTFQKTSGEGFDEMFRAHEMAHQWWGVGVRPASDHDRWMSEGFAEFSGLWYMARAKASAELYEKRLKESRERILKRRGKAPPIWMGSRVATYGYAEDYPVTVYDKGAWVLHMLRIMLTNYDDGSDDIFTGMMRDFYTSHVGKAVTTEQFVQAVEATVGQPMGWFFDEWVYGSYVPTYHFSYTLEEQPDGQTRCLVRVRQENVPPDFKMVVPIRLDFGEGRTAVARIMVSGPDTEAELPLLPLRPETVQFNPFEAVLAETKTEVWRN